MILCTQYSYCVEYVFHPDPSHQARLQLQIQFLSFKIIGYKLQILVGTKVRLQRENLYVSFSKKIENSYFPGCAHFAETWSSDTKTPQKLRFE